MPSDPGPLPAVQRVADAHLRGASGPIPTRVYWPAPTADRRPPPLLVLFHEAAAGEDPDRLCRGLCAYVGALVIARSVSPRPDVDGAADEAALMAEWAADHATEHGADAGRVVLAGSGDGCALAIAVAIRASERGWPPIARLVLLHPPTTRPTGRLHADVAPATVVEAEGGAYATGLRDAGVEVDVLPSGVGDDRLVVALGRALRRAIPDASG